jgi:hypothetical protein
MVFKIEQLLSNGLVTLIGKIKHHLVSQSPEQKIMELEAKVNSRETEVILERQAFVADKKSNHFDMMIDIAEEEYKIDIRKRSTRTIDHFKHKENNNVRL